MQNKINITFPDQSERQFDYETSGYEIANSISQGLAKQAILIELDGNLKDLSFPIKTDSKIKIIKKDADEALEVIRHDCAHVMAEAVQELFPGTQVTIGPAIENGFYYDFSFKVPFNERDLEKVEKKMAQIVDENQSFIMEEWKRSPPAAG